MTQTLRFGLFAAVLFITLLSFGVFANITGYETLNFTNYSAHVPAGGKTMQGFSLKLANGSYSFATTISIGNQDALAANGIVTIIQNSSGNPPLAGILYVSPTSTAKPGQYYISLTGSSYNVSVIPATLLLYVMPYGSATTSLSSSSTTSYNTTSITTVNTANFTSSIQPTSAAPGGSQQQGKGIDSVYYALVAVLIAVIAIIYLLNRRRPGTAVVSVPKPKD